MVGQSTSRNQVWRPEGSSTPHILPYTCCPCTSHIRSSTSPTSWSHAYTDLAWNQHASTYSSPIQMLPPVYTNNLIWLRRSGSCGTRDSQRNVQHRRPQHEWTGRRSGATRLHPATSADVMAMSRIPSSTKYVTKESPTTEHFICWYHCKFCDNAQKCSQGCQYKLNTPQATGRKLCRMVTSNHF